MTEANFRQNEEDDLDLIGLLERIYLYIRRFRILFLAALPVGIALGSIIYLTSPKVYQSKLILHASYLTNQEELEIIDYWNQLLQRSEYGILANILHCQESLLHEVVSLVGVEIQKNYSSTDPNGFYVLARVKDNSILPSLQGAIVYGLDNTEFVKQKIQERRMFLEGVIGKLTVQIAQLDSANHAIEVGLVHDSHQAASTAVGLDDLNRNLVDLNEKIQNYRTELQSLTSIHVLQGFIPLQTPVSRSLLVHMAVGLLLCIVVAYLFSIIKYVEDRLKKRMATRT